MQPAYIPTWFDWSLHVRCDDPPRRCKDPCSADPAERGPWAYTTNHDPDSGLARINFCPRYFVTPDLEAAAKHSKDDIIGAPWKYNVGSYLMNKAHVWAHELMHVD